MSDQHGTNLDGHKAWWPARPENADKVFGLLVATCVGLIIFDFVWRQLPHEHHPHFVFESMVGFNAVYGFVAFTFVVLAGSKLRTFIMRPEDYYDVPYTPPPDDDHGHHDDHDHQDDHGHKGGEHG
jgi:hypothetical protein